MGSPAEEDLDAEVLREQLRQAQAAARDAYQDTARLVRLLTILGRPGSPEDVVDNTLGTLSAVFQVDVTALLRYFRGRLVVTSAWGLPEDDPAFETGWVPSEHAARALTGTPQTARLPDEVPDADPDGIGELAAVRALGLRSATWLPLADGDRVDHLLVLYRSQPELLTTNETAMLMSIATRLLATMQARHRDVAMDLLARSGPVLTRYNDPLPLLEVGADLLKELVCAQHVAAFIVEDGQATLTHCSAGGLCPDGTSAEPLPGTLDTTELMGWDEALDGYPHLLRDVQLGGDSLVRNLLVVPTGPPGDPTAMVYVGWTDLPPLMAPVSEMAAVLATNLSAALAGTALYRALSASEASLRQITDSINDLIAVVNDTSGVVYASPSYDRIVALASKALVGRSMLDVVEPDDRDVVREAVLTSIATSSSTAIEYRLLTGDGRTVWVESVLRPHTRPDRKVVMSTRLVDERKNREEMLRRQATTDPLTGLANRAGAMIGLDEFLAADRPGKVGLLFCDLDKFKPVNDRLGHAAGDQLLREVAERLRSCTRAEDIVARLGGDEFLFLLDGVTSQAEVEEVGRRVAAHVARPVRIAGKTVRVSMSIGTAVGERRITAAAALLERADTAMYSAKRRGLVIAAG
jgi:diguanylate cyclase (GGDEF)-like protein/PAS domain S-box-containing protein